MAKPKNRMEVQVLLSAGATWRISGPLKNQTWTREVLVAELEKALATIKKFQPEDGHL